MRLRFGVRLLTPYLRSTPWIAASRRRDAAASASAAGKTSRPTDATTFELPRQPCRRC